MGIVRSSMFTTYKERIQALPSPLQDNDLRSSQFSLEKDEKRKLEIYYAPFEYINKKARILIAGITPGMHQMRVSYNTVYNLQNGNLSDEEILHEVKKKSSFEGSMRRNLVAMLDELGLASELGLTSSIELFGDANHLVQTASVLPHPVFFDGKNYNGSRPGILKTEMLKSHVDAYFAKDHSLLAAPLIIPLGVSVASVLEDLGRRELLDTRHLLKGFPHPSGSNGHRHRQFAQNKERMRNEIAGFFK